MQRLKKPYVIVAIVVIVLLCGFVIAGFTDLANSSGKLKEYTQMNIFEDISELDVLKTTEAELADEYINGLSVLRSFVHEVEYNSDTFEIYAYEFETVEDAKKYMELTRGVSEEKDQEYARYGKYKTYNMYVRDKCNLYRVKHVGSTSELIEIQKYLNSIFKTVVRE